MSHIHKIPASAPDATQYLVAHDTTLLHNLNSKSNDVF